MRKSMICLVANGLCGLVCVAAVAVAEEPRKIEFNRDVRSILSDKCYACHGPDQNKREADLRLDDEQSAKADHDGKVAIVPGKPDESELLRRILSPDPDERMPPGSTGKALTDAEIETLRQWIAQGATWQQHWAWIPPRKVEPPAADATLVNNDIDRFMLAQLATQGLTPAPLADRRTLLRRLSFDLLGLPPTPAEMQAFLADTSPEAYEKAVDRLLASRHFGERMAMYWLDVVRYADSGGYHSDNHRDVSLYRDYVIEAFNGDLPFDQFTIEQIAGDLLPNATVRQKIASGYNRLLQTTEEGGAQPKEYTAKYQADRVRNTAAAWLGVTMGCAECHNHKFDPFTTRDFYSFGAFFADVQEKAVGRQDQVALPTPEQEIQLDELNKQLATVREAYTRQTPELTAGLANWSATARADLLAGKFDWEAIKPTALESSGGQTLTIQDDLSVLASGENPDRDTYTVTLHSQQQTVTAIRLEALLHDSLGNKSLSRANGNFVLTEVELELRPANGEPRRLPIKEALADFSQDGFPVANAVDGKADTGWAVNGHQRKENCKALFVLAEPVSVPSDAALILRLRHDSMYGKHNIGRFRIATTASSAPQLADQGGFPADVIAALRVEPEQRNDAQRSTLDRHYHTLAPELADVRSQLAQLEQREKDLRAAFPQTLISVSMAPRTVRILPRGNWLDDSGEEVSPATPSALPAVAITDRQAARLDLAKWLASRDNPLTARVFVNRLWRMLYGQGLVRTLEDFGTQGQSPTHPELLDWLAIDFMEHGWSVKHALKTMLMSRTYQQSSLPSAEQRERDPTNKWLSHQNRFRLPAETVRDNALAISGLLSAKIGGPSVKPYQPAGYWEHLNFPKREWQNDQGENQYRRGLYTYWQRTFLHPSLLAFDASSREECTVERPRSNTPLQALVLLNDPTYVEAARVFAARILREGGDSPESRIALAFQQALNREPNEREMAVLRDLFQKHLAQYEADPAAAGQLTQVGQTPAPADMNLSALAAWTSIARTILNLHETITRY